MYNSFVINLDRQADRMAFMARQFDTLGLPYTRISAADGSDPAVRATAGFARYAPLTPGEIGVFESHRRIWQRVLDDGLPGAFALEDDVVIASDLGALTFPEAVLKSADLIKIDFHPKPTLLGETRIDVAPGRHIRRMIGTQNSAGCYFVTAQGAKRLLAQSVNYVLPVDLFMFDLDCPDYWTRELWKLEQAAASQWKFVAEPDTMPDAFEDNIQGARHSGGDPRRNMKFPQKTRVRLRLLTDWNFRAARTRRTARHQGAFLAQEAAQKTSVAFQTPSDAHYLSALDHIR